MVVRHLKRGESGRPAFVYSLHEESIDVFPKRYVEFILKLMEEVRKTYGQEALIILLESVGRRISVDIMNKIGMDFQEISSDILLKQKLQRITEYFEAQGRFPELIEDKNFFTLRKRNCIYFQLSQANHLICKIDEMMMNELFNHEAIKEQCMISGDKFCQYRIKKLAYKE